MMCKSKKPSPEIPKLLVVQLVSACEKKTYSTFRIPTDCNSYGCFNQGYRVGKERYGAAAFETTSVSWFAIDFPPVKRGNRLDLELVADFGGKFRSTMSPPPLVGG